MFYFSLICIPQLYLISKSDFHRPLLYFLSSPVSSPDVLLTSQMFRPCRPFCSMPMLLGGKMCISTSLRLFCFSQSKNEFRPTAGGFWVRGDYATPVRATLLVLLLLLSWLSPPFYLHPPPFLLFLSPKVRKNEGWFESYRSWKLD